MRLEGKRTVIVGISGMGGKVSEFFLNEGASVAILDIKEDVGLALEQELKQYGKIKFYQCDISKKEQVDSVMAEAIEFLGGIDTLINLAGVGPADSPETCTEELIDLTMNINFKGTVFTNQAAYKEMKKNDIIKGCRGCILNFGSADGVIAYPGATAYGCSKGAVLTWTKQIADAWARESSVRCNAILPSARTPMQQKYVDSLNEEELIAFKKELAAKVPLTGDQGEVEDVAHYLVFLASDEAKYVNGAMVEIDGGQLMQRG